MRSMFPLFLVLTLACSDAPAPCIDCNPCADPDGDGECNEVDEDDDNDGCLDSVDPAPTVASADPDGDGLGEDCDPCFGIGPDTDGDGLCHSEDRDADDNGCIDALDGTIFGTIADTNGDGRADQCADRDGDGCPDAVDPSPVADPDSDGDGRPDICDPDDDNDNCPDGVDTIVGPQDACYACLLNNDLDRDGLCNDVDDDIDGDGCLNEFDDLPEITGRNRDGDAFNDHCDDDDDNDGCIDERDADRDVWSPDSDGDGMGDHCDTDLDGDGCENTADAHPQVPGGDADGDGIGDDCDHDIVTLTHSSEPLIAVQQTPHNQRVVRGGRFRSTLDELDAQGRIVRVPAAHIDELVPSRQLCDLNGDGTDDLIATDSVLDGVTHAPLRVLSDGRLSRWAGCYDLDGDGTLQIIGVDRNDRTVVYRNGGNVDHSHGWTAVGVGQLDDDPALEIVANTGRTYDGATGEQEDNIGAQPTYVQLLDIDGDGVDDLLYDDGGIRVRSSTGIDWSFDQGVFLAGDFDTDGVFEVVVSVETPQGAEHHLLDAVTGQPRHPAVPGIPCTSWLAWDHDGDGVSHLQCTADDHASAGYDPLRGVWEPYDSQGANLTTPIAGDLDGDGIDEILWDGESRDRLLLRDVDGNLLDQMFLPHHRDGILTLLDIDADGRPEIVLPYAAWKWSPQDGFTSTPMPSLTRADRALEALADTDGDGNTEAFLRDRNNGLTKLDLGTGAITTLGLTTGFADFDGDGTLEWVETGAVVIRIHELDGTTLATLGRGNYTVAMGTDFVEHHGDHVQRWTLDPSGVFVQGSTLPVDPEARGWIAWGDETWAWRTTQSDLYIGVDALGGLVQVSAPASNTVFSAGGRIWLYGVHGTDGYRPIAR